MAWNAWRDLETKILLPKYGAAKLVGLRQSLLDLGISRIAAVTFQNSERQLPRWVGEARQSGEVGVEILGSRFHRRQNQNFRTERGHRGSRAPKTLSYWLFIPPGVRCRER